MEIPKQKTAVNGVENILDGFSHRLETAEVRVSEPEDQQKLCLRKNGKKNKTRTLGEDEK